MSNWGFKGGVHDTVVSPENVTVRGGSIFAVHERCIYNYSRLFSYGGNVCIFDDENNN